MVGGEPATATLKGRRPLGRGEPPPVHPYSRFRQFCPLRSGMAIFSLCHRAVGRSTHRAGTAGAHAAYITRRSAARVVIGQHMPTRPAKARAWLDEAEQADRKNARVIDKVMVALPLELDAAQREALIRVFIRRLSGDRVPWLAAIHDTGKDAHNPHAHILLRDRDAATGQRFVKLSDKDSTQRLRSLWEMCLNHALEALGSPQRVSRLSLSAQGVKRLPERHRGHSGHIAARLELGRTYGLADAKPVRPLPSRSSFPTVRLAP